MRELIDYLIGVFERERAAAIERWKLAVLALLVVLFFLSGFGALSQARFAIWGKMVNAAVVKKGERVVDLPNKRVTLKLVEYQFVDVDGSVRTEGDVYVTEPQWTKVEASGARGGEGGDGVMVDYIPGSPGSSHVSGKSNATLVWVFAGMLLVVIAWTGYIWVGYARFQRMKTPSVGGRS